MAEKNEAKNYGLRLNLPGAPGEAHTVPTYPGWYWPDAPTPVGGEGEVSLEDARKADKAEGVPLELVEVTKTKADARRTEIAAWRANARRALRTVTPHSADEHLDAGKET